MRHTLAYLSPLFIGVVWMAACSLLVDPTGRPREGESQCGNTDPSGPDCSWYDLSWQYRKEITISAGMVSVDQTFFPFLLHHPTDSDLSARARSDGFDILFTEADGLSKLDHEIEDFSPGTGELVVWIAIPFLSSSIDTSLFLYYGNGSATNQENPAAVWDDNYLAVYHLNESPANGVSGHDDSSGNPNDARPQGFDATTESTTAGIGLINGAVKFDGIDDSVIVPDSSAWALVPSASYTWSLWIKPDDLTASFRSVWRQANADDRGVGICPHSTKNDNMGPVTNGVSVGWDESASQKLGVHSTNDALVVGRWQHVAVTYNGSAPPWGRFSIYVDGADVTDWDDVNVYGSMDGVDPTSIAMGGDPQTSSNHFDGVLDEVRISSTVRSRDWLVTSIVNQADPSMWVTVGPEVQR
ncbi:DUF2341 domain-containing protein [Myxococcota bacterium]